MFNRDAQDNSTYNIENYEFIKRTSPVVGALIEKEYNRQKNNIELIASENYCSEAVLAACGSCLSWKYAEGYPYVRTSGNTSSCLLYTSLRGGRSGRSAFGAAGTGTQF